MLEANVIEDGKTLESRFIHIGDIPVMVKSESCILRSFTQQKLIDYAEDPEDPGGYFIINGSERVIVGLEDLSYNKIIVDAEKVGGKKVFKAKGIFLDCWLSRKTGVSVERGWTYCCKDTGLTC